jgi:periplasmic protein TonB
MSESSVPVQPSLVSSANLTQSPSYKLSDDLARLCLPQEFKDSYRKLAWANSICALFLIVGVVGFKPQKVIHKPLSEISDPVQLVFTPPEDQPKPEVLVQQEEPDEARQEAVDMPQVVAIVAAADSANVAFSVPVQGAVVVAPAAHLAAPPPPITHQAPSQPVKFNPNTATDGGSYPPPQYPASALRNRQQGSVTVDIVVDASGQVSVARLQKSSGTPSLDQAALDVVKQRWRFPPGALRNYYWVCTFQMQ